MVKLYFMLSNLTNFLVGNVNFSNGESSFVSYKIIPYENLYFVLEQDLHEYSK